jgi:hypothetical protein
MNGDDELIFAEIFSGSLPTGTAGDDKPSGNFATFLNDISNTNSQALNDVSDFLGAFADISGAIGTVSLIISLFNSGQPDQVMIALQDIMKAISQDFAQLNADLAAQQALLRNTTLNGYLSPAWARLQSLPAAVNAQPPISSGDRINFIADCLTTLDNLTGPTQPDLVWNMDFDWHAFWSDEGQFGCPCFGRAGHDSGYGKLPPTQNGDGTVFVYTYALPLYLWAVSILLAVGFALDPNFLTNYQDTLRSAAAYLKSKHDQIVQQGITQLIPNWIGTGLVESACRPIGDSRPSAPGITLLYKEVHRPRGYGLIPIAAVIEYGCVEKYSGASWVGSNYRINFDPAFTANNDPAIFNKLQIRALKRTKGVYIGCGLGNVYQTVSKLQTLVGDGALPFPGYADWSFQPLIELSGLTPTSAGYSMRAFAAFMINTQPFDTPYTDAPATTTLSVRNILTYFAD